MLNRHNINFEKSQILRKDGPLVHPDNVLCSDTLRDKVSFYAQFELAPTFRETCGPRYRNASMNEWFLQSNDLGMDSAFSDFSKYSMCMYEIFNPYPDHTIYINVYR